MKTNIRTSRRVPGTRSDNRTQGAERRETILQGISSGKSRRRIAAELGVDEGTVRRDLRIAMLPESYLEAIEGGATPEQYLRSEKREAEENANRLRLALEKRAAEISKTQRLAEEKVSGRHSDALARQLLRWLRGKFSANAYIEQLLQIVEPANRRIGDQLATPHSRPSLALALCGWNDDPSYMPEKIQYLAGVLLDALPLITPEWAIRYRAIRKVARVIENPLQCPKELRC